jgi:transposase
LPKKQRYGRQARWPEHAEVLSEIVRQTPDITLEELKARLPAELSISTIWRALKALGLSLKTKS